MNDSLIRILMVEDNPADAKLIEFELRRGGIRFHATHVETEIDFCKALEDQFDVVLCDWTLPQFNCLRALSIVRDRDQILPFIIVSGSIGEEAAVEAIKLGASDYLIKDRLGRLAASVRQSLNQRDYKNSAATALERLRVREFQLAEAQRVARMGSWVWKPSHGDVWWSDGMYILFGVDSERAKPSFELFLSLLHPDERPTAIRRVDAMLAGAEEFENDFRAIRPDGVAIWIHSRARATRNADGDILSVDGIDQDITDRINTESKMRKANNLLQSVLGSVTDSILTINAAGDIQMANKATEKMFHCKSEELHSGNITSLIAESCRDSHKEFFASVVRGMNDSGGSREYTGIRADGTMFPIEVSISGFAIEGEKYFTEVIHDVSERKKLQQKLYQAQKMEAIGRLAGGIAHDFNNLLTVIMGYSEILLAQFDKSDPSIEFVRQMNEAGQRAAELTGQLLAFGRKSIVQTKVLNLNTLIDNLRKMLRPLIGEDVELFLELDPNILNIEADPSQIEQVLVNLIVNARDAMPLGGKLTVSTSLSSQIERPSGPNGLQPRHYVKVCVTDTGFGMPAEILDQVFEPFFTTKAIGQGTGLGLATAYSIVEHAGGTIEVQSEVGVGTTFTIYFPAVTIDTTNDSSDSNPLSTLRGTETILLVEDELPVLQLVRTILESQGYVVHATTEQTEAIEIATNYAGTIDILITDVVMPKFSGRGIAELVRNVRPNIRVLYMSGYTNDAVLRYGVETGSNSFLQKPITPHSLARKVRETLDVQR